MASPTLANIIAAIRAMIPNITSTQYSDANVTICLEQALRRLNRDKPRKVTALVTGDGGNFYQATTVLTSWVEDWSIIEKVIQNSPTIANEEEINHLNRRGFEVYHDGTNEQIRFDKSFGSSDTVTVTYTAKHTVNGVDGETADTIPSKYENAVEFLTATIVCYALAAQAAGNIDSALPGDLIDWRSKNREYTNQGKTFEGQYEKELGMSEVVAAGVARNDFEPTLSGGAARMTHRR